MRLYLIRHGETLWNSQGRLQGKSDIPLNEKGKRLAEKTGRALRKKNIRFARGFTSPLARARETAEALLGKAGVYLEEDDRLMEISFGSWEGLSCKKDNYEIPSKGFELFFADPFSYLAPAGGESIEDVCRRSREFLEDLLARYGDSDDHILLSTHGCTLRGLQQYLDPREGEDFWRGRVSPNCGITVYDIARGEISCLAEDWICYEETGEDPYDPIVWEGNQ